MTILSYTDAYLRPLVTNEIESRAAREVDEVGPFPANWTDRLTVLRAYILTCLDSMKAPEDTFATKLAAYRKEWDQHLTQARLAQQAEEQDDGTATGGGSMFTVPLERA